MINIKDNGSNNTIFVSDDVTSDINRVPIVISGNNNKVHICSGVELNSSLINVIGSDCYIYIGGNCRFIRGNLIVNQSSSIIIGSGTTWASGAFRAEHESTINIGKDCMFAADIHIRTSDGHGIFDRKTKMHLNPSADVLIGDRVWLGHDASISKGTTIGNGVVVGQKSLTTGTLKPNSIYGGVPAKLIREDIVWSAGLTFDSIPLQYR